MERIAWAFVVLLCVIRNEISGEDCSTVAPSYIPHLSERIVGYTLQGNDVPICDAYLDQKWYNLTTEYAIARSTKTCGTDYNWYLKDPLPTDGQNAQTLTVCRYEDENNKCSETKQIKGLKCQTGYLFLLMPLDGCNEAYCLENTDPTAVREKAPDISYIHPVVSAGIVFNGKNEIQFYCDINTTISTNYHYVIEWSLHTGLSLVSSIYAHMPTQFDNKDHFRSKTALTEQHLRVHGITKPGFKIGCSVKAQQGLTGYFSHPQKSLPKYFGLQIVNNTGSTISVTGENPIVKIQAILTMPFGCIKDGCFLDFQVSIPKTIDQCTIPSLVSLEQRQGTKCGIRFSNEDVMKGNPKDFIISAKFGNNLNSNLKRVYNVVLFTNGKNNDHKFFESYMGASIRVDLTTDMKKLQNKECRSESDPHIMTFDGVRYDNHNNGTYTMYKHKELQVEVQTQLKPCWNYDQPWRPLCNCGVAVRAGRDIFQIDRCTSVVKPAATVLCDDAVLKGKIRKEGNVFKIFLPTGGVVQLTDIHGFFNVVIYPSLVDYGKTEGLCGILDGSIANDIGYPNGQANANDILKWKVSDSRSLFIRNNDKMHLKWREERYLCDCGEVANGITTAQAECDTETKYLCKEDDDMDKPKQDKCNDASRRRKRSNKDRYGESKFDGYSDPETAFFKIKKVNTNHTSIERPILERRSVQSYDNATSRIECLRLMNTTVFQMCSSVPDLDVDGLIENCVNDALLSNSMHWTLMHLESIKQKCIRHVDVMQPIPQEILDEISIDPFDNSTNSTNSTDNAVASTPASITRPAISIITPELLLSLKSLSCPNECSSNGVCNNGTCLCNEPFISFDCSVNKTMPPEMIGIPDKGLCDLSIRACEQTSVIGKNFAETSSLKCSLVPFQIESNGTIIYQEEMETTGMFESLDEIYCQLPQTQVRSRRSTATLSDYYISRGYHVSVSNDGVGFSDSDSIVIFDSTCVECHKELDKIICSTKQNYCVKNGMCHTLGETEGCYMCLDTTPNHVGWIAGPDCAEQIIPEGEKKLWIIGAVLGPFATCAVVLAVVLCYFWKRQQLAKAKVGSLTDMKDS